MLQKIWSQIWEKNGVTVALLLDFKSAFPFVDHQILKIILKFYNNDDKTQKWFNSYLENRCQYTKTKILKSNFAKLNKGVFQGDSTDSI
jgi:hypothetical protein